VGFIVADPAGAAVAQPRLLPADVAELGFLRDSPAKHRIRINIYTSQHTSNLQRSEYCGRFSLMNYLSEKIKQGLSSGLKDLGGYD
jgi:hypothetical protein